MLCLHSKYLVKLRLVPTCNDQKNAHSNVNITRSFGRYKWEQVVTLRDTLKVDKALKVVIN